MCAIVRFVEDKTDKRYVIPVADITTSTSITRWFDKDDDDSSGIYAVQILKLAATEEEMARETKNKRVPIPPIRYLDVDDLSVPEGDVATKKESHQTTRKGKAAKSSNGKKAAV